MSKIEKHFLSRGSIKETTKTSNKGITKHVRVTDSVELLRESSRANARTP